MWSVNCLFFERVIEEGAPLDWGIQLCGSSSCVWGFRSLLNTEGIMTLPMFLLSDISLIQMWSASFAWWFRVMLSQAVIVKSVSSAFGCFLEMWWLLMALVVWFLWSETLFFQGPVGFTYVLRGAVVGWAVPVVDDVSFLKSGMGSFGCMSEDVMVPLKETPILYFIRVCLYCSLGSLMYGMTILVLFINFPVDGFGFLFVSFWSLPCWYNCAG